NILDITPSKDLIRNLLAVKFLTTIIKNDQPFIWFIGCLTACVPTRQSNLTCCYVNIIKITNICWVVLTILVTVIMVSIITSKPHNYFMGAVCLSWIHFKFTVKATLLRIVNAWINFSYVGTVS